MSVKLRLETKMAKSEKERLNEQLQRLQSQIGSKERSISKLEERVRQEQRALSALNDRKRELLRKINRPQQLP